MINKSKLYDLIYAKADKLFKEYNPCNIQKNKRGKLTCTCQFYKDGSVGLCCTRHGEKDNKCKYLSDSGCTTNCLSCKLYYCKYKGRHISQKDYDRFIKELQTLRSICYKYELHGNYFVSKEDIFGD